MTVPPVSSNRKLLGKQVEVYDLKQNPSEHVQHALFDFDGTLSLIRGGWQDVMVSQFVSVLKTTNTAETDSQFRGVCRKFITQRTGQQTIYQMLQLEEEMHKRGGNCDSAAIYKKQYLDLLDGHIKKRIESLRHKPQNKECYMVRGAELLLARLRRAGVICYLASGTDHHYVVQETELLGLTSYFEGDDELRIYGARDDYKSFSKKHVIEHIMASHHLQGNQLVAFGDGYVEIQEMRAIGGIAVGVASLESGEEGWDLWKKERLLQGGAQILAPDWVEFDVILDYLGVPK